MQVTILQQQHQIKTINGQIIQQLQKILVGQYQEQLPLNQLLEIVRITVQLKLVCQVVQVVLYQVLLRLEMQEVIPRMQLQTQTINGLVVVQDRSHIVGQFIEQQFLQRLLDVL